MMTTNLNMLDACVLACLEGGPSYGYVLTQKMMKEVECSESTLYPILRRLEKAGLLSSCNTLVNGRNRRLYQITDAGRDELTSMREEWKKYKSSVDRLLNRPEGGSYDKEEFSC